MNENLKKRILGVIIIIIVSIIILPMLFKGSGKPELKYSNIDSQNDIKFKYINKAKNLKKETKEHNDFLVEEKKILDVKTLNEGTEIKNWVIRVGTFSKKINALNFLKKLENIKYQSYIMKINKEKEALYAVNIGPFFSAKEVKKVFIKIIETKDFKNSYIIESNFK